MLINKNLKSEHIFSKFSVSNLEIQKFVRKNIIRRKREREEEGRGGGSEGNRKKNKLAKLKKR